MSARRTRERIRQRQASAESEPGQPTETSAAPVRAPEGLPSTAAGHDFGSVAIHPSVAPIGPSGGALSPVLDQRIRSQQGGGAPLEPTMRERMETGFGHSFADVRVHTDAEADALNRGVGASAFTHGSDIFLGEQAAGRGASGTDSLIAHELGHVVQQRSSDLSGPLTVGAMDAPSERAAQHAAQAVTQGGAAGSALVPLAGGATIQREPPDPPAGTADPSTGSSIFSGISTALTVAGAVLSNPANAATGYKGPVHVEEWHEKQLVGPTPARASRAFGEAYIGDKYLIEAKVADPAGASINSLHVTESIDPLPYEPTSKFIIERTYPAPSTIAWTIIPTTPGRQTLNLNVGDSLGLNGDSYGLEIGAGADPTWFKGRLSTAETKLNTMYAMGQGWFYDTFQAYMKAYNDFDGALRRQDAADRLVGDLLLGVLFAAAGGAVGGAIGGMMKNAEEAGRTIGKVFNNVAQGTITDTYKDVAKFIVRIPAGPMRDGALAKTGVTDAAPTASTDPTKAGVAQGDKSVAAIDPLNWFAMIQSTISKERGAVGMILTGLQEVIDEFLITDPLQVWNWDPLETVMQAATLDGKPLDQLGPIPDPLAYERSMWEVWLANYAWKVMKHYSTFGGQYAQAYNAVGGKLEEEIDRVAKKFGETGEQWIARYGGKSKAQAEAEAEKFNKNTPLGQLNEAVKRIRQ